MLPALIGISGHEVGAEEEAAIRRWQPAGGTIKGGNGTNGKNSNS